HADVGDRHRLKPAQHRRARPLHDVAARVRVQHVAGHQGSRSCTGSSSTSFMNASDATGALSRYGRQSRGRGERITSWPSLRMKTSSVENWYSLGSRTAWLRLVMKTLAVRGMVRSLRPIMPYTLRIRLRVRITCLYPGF